MNDKDIRWIQRYSNFLQALNQLKNAVDTCRDRELNLLEKQGLIQSFEFTHELAWKVLKDFFEYQGNFNLKGSRDAVKEAFNNNLISDGKLWLQMNETRNLTTHTYDQNTAEQVLSLIVHDYYPALLEFRNIMNGLKAETE